MPQKKIIKKAAKKQTKKAAPVKKVVSKPLKKAADLKKSVSKPVNKQAKKAPVVKKLIKKAAVKPILKTSAKSSGKNLHTKAIIKHLPKPIVNSHTGNKVIPMAKQKKQEEQVVSKPQKQIAKKQEPAKEIKLPKITTKTSVPYQPSYKSLEQRNEVVKPSEPLVRYNDNDLNEFRELIQKKLDSAKKELGYLQGLITRKDDMGGDESENRYMTMEDGSMSMEREQLSQMASRQITYIDHLEKSLIRIENKTYGICRVTGKLIDKARLRAVPHATLSLEAKLGLVKAGE